MRAVDDSHAADNGFASSALPGFVNQRLIAAVDFVAWMQQREIRDRRFPGFHFIASGLRLLQAFVETMKSVCAREKCGVMSLSVHHAPI